jgi:hypothetical protein
MAELRRLPWAYETVRGGVADLDAASDDQQHTGVAVARSTLSLGATVSVGRFDAGAQGRNNGA